MDQIAQSYGRTYNEQLDRVRRFWDGEGRAIVSLSVDEPSYRQCFDDEQMVNGCKQQLPQLPDLPGINLPTFSADFGTISTAKYFGGKIVPPRHGAMIYIEPVTDSIEQAIEITPAPIDDPEQDVEHGLALWRRLCRELDTDKLWLRTPDMQGVLNTAGLVVQQEALLMAMLEDADLVHRWLDRVCDFLIDMARYEREQTGGRLCGNLWPYTFLPADLGVSFTEDLMPLLPADLYEQFAVPRLKRFEQELGPLHIHCCGAYAQHVPTLIHAGLNIRAIEFHYPHTTIEDVRPLAERGTVLIPYIAIEHQREFDSILSYWRWLLDSTPDDVRFWFAAMDAAPDTQAFARAVCGA